MEFSDAKCLLTTLFGINKDKVLVAVMGSLFYY